jgi:hypothetical protein
MELVHLSTSLVHFEGVAAFVNAQPSPVLVSLTDANTVVAVAALKDQWRCAMGVWLEVDEGYVASICARDVKSLSWLIELDHVVISAPNARAQAQVVTAMLTNDEVNFVNEVAVIRGAFNRPAPPHPVRVWSFDGATLASDGDELHATSSSNLEVGSVTTYS